MTVLLFTGSIYPNHVHNFLSYHHTIFIDIWWYSHRDYDSPVIKVGLEIKWRLRIADAEINVLFFLYIKMWHRIRIIYCFHRQNEMPWKHPLVLRKECAVTSVVTVSWRLKAPATWLFIQHFVQINNIENIRTWYYWIFVMGIHCSLVVSLIKGQLCSRLFHATMSCNKVVSLQRQDGETTIWMCYKLIQKCFTSLNRTNGSRTWEMSSVRPSDMKLQNLVNIGSCNGTPNLN